MMVRIAVLSLSLTLVTSVFARSSKMDSEMAALRTYCKADVARLCPKVQPGGGRIKGCLMEHKNEMSVGCAKALQELKH